MITTESKERPILFSGPMVKEKRIQRWSRGDVSVVRIWREINSGLEILSSAEMKKTQEF